MDESHVSVHYVSRRAAHTVVTSVVATVLKGECVGLQRFTRVGRARPSESRVEPRQGSSGMRTALDIGTRFVQPRWGRTTGRGLKDLVRHLPVHAAPSPAIGEVASLLA